MKAALTSLLALLLAGCSCGREEPAPPTDGGRPAGAATPAPFNTTVQLSEDVIRAAGIKTVPAEKGALAQTLELTGEVAADPDRTARVTARAPGRVVDVRFKEGERVEAGALLAVLESPDLARARAALTATQARAATARQNAERLRRLSEKGLTSQQELFTAEAEARALDADATAARQSLAAFGVGTAEAPDHAGRLELRAPIAGFVIARDAVKGQMVAADHELASIADLKRAFFVARLFEKDLAWVTPGAHAEVRLNAYPDKLFEAVVDSVGRSVEPKSRTLTARIALEPGEDVLKVGLFGTALIERPGAEESEVVQVRSSAVTRIADHDVVFTRDGTTFKAHVVTLGRTTRGVSAILEGIAPGDEVVVEGVFTLKSAVLKSSFGEEE